jgi:hypothetical protein
MKIFILSGSINVAINIARDLDNDYDFWIICPKNNLEFLNYINHSRFWKKVIKVNNYLEYFKNEIYEKEKTVIFPTHDFDINEILNHHTFYEKNYIANLNNLSKVINKFFLYKTLDNISIPKLKLYYDISEMQYPVVIKEKLRKDHKFWKSFSSKFIKAYNENELKKLYGRLPEKDNVIFQEYLPKTSSNEYSYIGYRSKAKKITGDVVRKTHQIKQGGVTTFAEFFKNEKITSYSKQILEALDYTGIFEIEYLYEPQKNEFYFIDFNARCCHWYNLLSSSGLNLPELYIKDIIGQELDKNNRDYSIKFVDLKGEIFHAIILQNHFLKKIENIFWLRNLLKKQNIAYSIYDKNDKSLNEYLIKKIKSRIKKYYISQARAIIKKALKLTGLYDIIKKRKK